MLLELSSDSSCSGVTLASGISVRVDDVTVDWVDSLGDVGKYESTEQVAKALIEFLVVLLTYQLIVFHCLYLIKYLEICL